MLTRRWASVWQKWGKQVLQTAFFLGRNFEIPSNVSTTATSTKMSFKDSEEIALFFGGQSTGHSPISFTHTGNSLILAHYLTFLSSCITKPGIVGY